MQSSHQHSYNFTKPSCKDIADERESVATRSPSPPTDDDGMMDSEGASVVIRELEIDDVQFDGERPKATNGGGRPGMAHFSQSSGSKLSTGASSRVSKIKKKRNGAMFKSFTGGTTTSAAIALPAAEEADDGAGGRRRSMSADADDPDDDGFLASLSEAGDDPRKSVAITEAHEMHDLIPSMPLQSKEEEKLAKRWVPKGRSARRLKNASGLLSSFKKKIGPGGGVMNNHSSHAQGALSNLMEDHSHHAQVDLSNLLEEDEMPLDDSSDHGQAHSQDGLSSTASNPYEDYSDQSSRSSNHSSAGSCLDRSEEKAPRRSRRTRQSSNLSSMTSHESVGLNHELDLQEPKAGSSAKALLESLGDHPTSRDLANVAAKRAKEYIEECLSADVYVVDRKKWESIPQYSKRDLLVGQHLGKGSFSDAFEVIATVVDEEDTPTLQSLGEDREDLGRMMEKKFRGSEVMKSSKTSGGRGEEDNQRKPKKDDEEFSEDDMDAQIEAMFGVSPKETRKDNQEDGSEEDKDDLDREIEAMFGASPGGADDGEKDDLDKEIEAKFGASPGGADNNNEKDDLDKEIEAMFGNSDTNLVKKEKVKEFKPALPHERRSSRRLTSDANFGKSICLGAHSRQRQTHRASSNKDKKKSGRKVMLAMKCLRPQIRSDVEQFIVGVEDLVHETAMLASLDHPNVVRLHGRAGGGCVGDSMRLSDGYFILLDRLNGTLEDRIPHWKKTFDKRAPPSLTQIKTACAIADAMSYLHSKCIVFRDLKPANVGFDSTGVLKLFDFGFAIGIDEPPPRPASICDGDDDGSVDSQESHLLYDRCGTPRYMAPEVGLGSGYGLPADVYSIGILLWQICSLKKPFEKVRSADEFHRTVFEKGSRPKLGKHWPKVLTDTMEQCWSTFPAERPRMDLVKSMLAAHARQLAMQQQRGGNSGKDLKKSFSFRRFTG